VMYGIFR